MSPEDVDNSGFGAPEDASNQLIIDCYNLEKLSEAIRNKFHDDLQKLSHNRPRFYAFRERNKGAKSIYSKVLRKRKEGLEHFSPRHVTDAWGCRLITLFQADVLRVFEDLLKYIQRRKQRNEDLDIVEINVYDNRPENDPLSIGPMVSGLLRRFTSDGVRLPHIRKSRESGYSSVHIILRATVYSARPGKAPESLSGLFEVQIRDIFEEGWSEISHQLSYRHKDELNAPSAHANDEAWRRLLNALKTVADGCSQHASLIEPIAIGLRGESSEARAASITDLGKDKEALISHLPEDHEALLQTLDEAYSLLEEALQTSEEKLDASLAAPFYRAASLKFAKAVRLAGPLGAIPATFESVTQPRPIGFILRLEQANAAMFSLSSKVSEYDASEAALHASAMAIYRRLTQEIPDDAFTRYRFGHSCIRTAATAEGVNEGIGELRKSYRLALNSSTLGADHWLYAAIPTHLGRGFYRLSRFAQEKGDKERAMTYLKQALTETNLAIDAISIKNEQNGHKLRIYHRAVSNKIYFIYLLKATDENCIHPEKYTERDRLEIAECVDLLSSAPLDAYANVFVEPVDNIMIGAFILGKLDLAIEKAYDSIGFLRNIAQRKAGRKANVNLEAHLDEQRKVMFRRAVSVLTKGWTEAEKTEQTPSNARGLLRQLRFWDR